MFVFVQLNCIHTNKNADTYTYHFFNIKIDLNWFLLCIKKFKILGTHVLTKLLKCVNMLCFLLSTAVRIMVLLSSHNTKLYTDDLVPKTKFLWRNDLILSPFFWGQTLNLEQTIFAKLSPGQTLALAYPEARHYDHPETASAAAANVCIGIISAISQRNELNGGGHNW